MARATITRKIQITEPPEPGDLPSSGAALLIAPSGGHQAVRPSPHNTGGFTNAIFEAFGSGTFNPYYSTDGAFITAATGGHAHYEIVGQVGFDFTAREWFYIPVPGVAEAIVAYEEADTNGSPWYEIDENQTPAPAHPYASLTAIDVGSKGSLLYVGRAAVAREARTARVAHRVDCATGIWSRASTNEASGDVIECSIVQDPVTGRIYRIQSPIHAINSLPYLDTDGVFKSASTGGYGAVGTGLYSKCFYVETGGKRLLVNIWGTLTQAIDLDNMGAGWQTLTMTGASLSVTFNPPVWHQEQGVLYHRASSGAGNKLTKITPPVGDPISGTWTRSEVTLTGDTVPEFMGTNVTTEAYQSLFYIPEYEMLGWVTAFGVALLNP